MRKARKHKIKYINGVAHVKLCEGFRESRGRRVCVRYGWIPRGRVRFLGQRRRR